MKTESTRVLGLDVSKHNVTCHILERYPSGGLSRYWSKTRNQAARNYPVFYPTFRTSVCSTNRLRQGRYLDALSDKKMNEKS